MHNHVANCGRKALLKQIFSVFLIFTLYFNSFNFAHASTLGGWTITNQIAQGASTVLNATKTAIINGASVLKTSTAKITPNATQVAKVLRGGIAGYALSIAVEQIIGADYSWWIDGDLVKYRVPADPNNVPKCWYLSNVGCFATYTAAASAAMAHYNSTAPDDYRAFSYDTQITNNNSTLTVTLYKENKLTAQIYTFGYIDNPAYNPNAEEEERSIPLVTVAQKVIDNAESSSNNDHKVGAQVATTAAAEDMLANDPATQADVETQLNANAKTQTSEEAAAEATPKDPAAPEAGTDIKINFPVFCSWAPIVCEAAQSAIKFPTTVTNWWNTATTSISDAWTWTKARYEASVTSISDFFKNEPDDTDNTDLPVQEIPTPQLETNTFRATAGCPEPIPIQIKIGVEGTTYISYEPICQFASKWSFIAPLIGFLSGAMIIVGVGRKGEDSEI